MPKRKKNISPRSKKAKTEEKTSPTGIDSVVVGLESKQRSLENGRATFDEVGNLMQRTQERLAKMRDLVAEQEADSAQMKKLHLPDAWDIISELFHDLLVMADELNPAGPRTTTGEMEFKRITLHPPKHRRKGHSGPKVHIFAPLVRVILKASQLDALPPSFDQALMATYGEGFEAKRKALKGPLAGAIQTLEKAAKSTSSKEQPGRDFIAKLSTRHEWPEVLAAMKSWI